MCCARLGGVHEFLRNCLSYVTFTVPTALPAHKRFDSMLLVSRV